VLFSSPSVDRPMCAKQHHIVTQHGLCTHQLCINMCPSLSRFSHLHLFLSKFKVPKHLFKSGHDVILSHLIFSHFKVIRRRTGKADSIGIPIQNYLLVNRNSNPFILLVGAPIPILLNISLVPTMRPGSIERRPVKEVVNDGLIDGQTRDLH